jgi:hypothetical protein
MSFQIINWSEVSVSLNQGIITAAVDTPSSDSNVQQGSQNVFTYFSPTDTIATISASNYFNQAIPNTVMWSVEVGDMIFVEGSDYNTILEVLTVVLPTDGSSGTITTGVWLNNGSLVEYSTTTTINNAALLAMYDTPVQLVPAQGAGSLILVDKVVIDYHYSTASTAAGGAIAAQYDSTVHGGGVAASQTVAAATLNGFSANAVMTAGSVQIAQADTAVYNKGIYLSNASADFTTGAGSLVVYTYYRVLSPA